MSPKPSIIRKTPSITTNERVSPLFFEVPEGRPPDALSNGMALQVIIKEMIDLVAEN